MTRSAMPSWASPISRVWDMEVKGISSSDGSNETLCPPPQWPQLSHSHSRPGFGTDMVVMADRALRLLSRHSLDGGLGHQKRETLMLFFLLVTRGVATAKWGRANST